MAVRKYDQGFKEEAVRHLLTSGKQLKEIAEDLGIHPSTLREWRNAYWARQEAGNSHEEDPATTKALADKMKNLQKENDLLRRQRDILKKALGILSQHGRDPGCPRKKPCELWESTHPGGSEKGRDVFKPEACGRQPRSCIRLQAGERLPEVDFHHSDHVRSQAHSFP